MIVIGPPRLTSVFKFSAKERVIPTSRRISHQLITVCNSRCAFYCSEVLKLCTGYVTRTGKVKVKWSRYRPGIAQRVGRGIALLFHDRGTRRGWVVSLTPRPHLTPGKDPGPILQKGGWAPGPVWTGGNLVRTGIRSPDRPPRSHSLEHDEKENSLVIRQWNILIWSLSLTPDITKYPWNRHFAHIRVRSLSLWVGSRVLFPCGEAAMAAWTISFCLFLIN